VICGVVHTPGTPLATITAFSGSGPVQRDIVSTSLRWPLLVGLPMGCEFDSQDRKLYTSFSNLGMVVRFDYDSGNLEKIYPAWIGARALAYDGVRRWLYISNFLSGMVVAVDADTGALQASWFVGRFPRQLRPTHDGKALLVASNIGLVRVSLEPE
jgi:DNA-binding beta-propeller fold protein YncE